MSRIWIVDRDPKQRATLARLAGAADSALLAGPGDPQLATAAAPDAVLIGLGDDLEAELQLVHRQGVRLTGTRWVLLDRSGDLGRVERLFDAVDRVVLPFPPDARELHRVLAGAAARPAVDPLPLSQRPARDQLSERFARWFADLDVPELLRLLDPRLADVPVLICGEPGTGRGLLARYLHTFGGAGAGALFRVVCSADSSPEDLLRQLAGPEAAGGSAAAACIWLDGADRLPSVTQRSVAGWIEYGSPRTPAPRTRWVATAASPDPPLAADLRRALSAFCITLPPLRERVPLIAPFVTETAQAWCAARGERLRRFGEDAIGVLEEYPWPGNLAELEAAVVQTLLTSSGSPIHADDLVCDGYALAPLDAESVGVRLVDEPGRAVLPEVEAVEEPAVRSEVEATPAPPRAAPPETAAVEESALRRLVAAVAHEVRNPLTTIRNFTALLPENYRDADFRGRFVELVDEGVARIEAVVDEIAALAAQEPPRSLPVDVTQLLEELLEDCRGAIRSRHLVVLKELERNRPDALGDASQLRASFGALLRKCLELAPERGDLYLASRFHPSGLRGGPSLRILVRFSGSRTRGAGGPEPVAGVSPAENAVEFATVEAVARAHGGALAIQSGEGDETVVVVDLPAPA